MTGSATQQATCASGGYSFTITKLSDATYNFTLTQTDPSGNTSATAAQKWIRDTAVPSAVAVTTPASLTSTSSANSLTITGAGTLSCETGNTVTLTGDATLGTTCSGGAYSFTVSPGSDGTYEYVLSQRDGAANTSATVTVTWTRDTLAPGAVVVNDPAPDPYYSASTSLTLSGTCETDASVTVTGSSSLGATCAAGSYGFTITKTVDQTYSFTLTQSDAAGNTSSSTSATWILDRVAPSAVAISSPASATITNSDSSITITGVGPSSCESGATVSLTGSGTQQATCSSGGYSFTISKVADSTYNFTLTQSDLTGNTSSTTTQRWVRDTTAPTAGNSGTIAFTSVAGTSMTVTWTAATDSVTAAASLQYKVYRSSSANIGTWENAQSNGAQVADWTSNITSVSATGLTGSTTYHFNVFVRDGAGNIAAYTQNSQATADGTPPSVSSGTLSFSNVKSGSVDLSWSEASDGVTATSALEYKVVVSLSNNISSASTAEANGTTVADWSSATSLGASGGTISGTISSLAFATTYYFNVLVRDAAGNVSAYTSASQATNAQARIP